MADLLETLRERTAPWLEPIPGPSPGGAAARLDPEYQAVANEVAKLDSPIGGEVNWKAVTEAAGALLRSRSKDVLLGAYLAHALHVTGGLEGLATGAALLSELLDRYWDSAFPELKRLRGRANAVQWFVEKTQAALPAVRVGAGDLPQVEALDSAAQRLAQVVRGRFADAAPAMGGLLEAVTRLMLDAEAAAPPPAPAPAAVPEAAPAAAPPASPAAAPAPATAPPAAPAAAPATSAPLPSAPTGAVPAADGAVEWLRDVGAALASAGNVVRRAGVGDPLGYRILRTGLWLHLSAPPPAEGGRTSVPPPSAELRSELQLMAQNGKWAAALEEAESALAQHRFWLDLHRISAQALGALGHDRARDAIATELRALLARIPALPSLAFGDGTPLADAQTRSWIDEEIAPRAAGREAAGPAADDGAAPDPAVLEKLGRARKLLGGGQAREALAELQVFVEGRPAGRARFRARLDLARACAGAGLLALAKATYEDLDAEAVAHDLERWEPPLAAEVLAGLIGAARALGKDPRAATPSLEARYQRLCRLDPAAAHEVWP